MMAFRKRETRLSINFLMSLEKYIVLSRDWQTEYRMQQSMQMIGSSNDMREKEAETRKESG